jgi:hypothetical protein
VIEIVDEIEKFMLFDLTAGGQDGMVYIWNMQLAKIWSLNLLESTPPSNNPQIQAIAATDGKILIGEKTLLNDDNFGTLIGL